MKSMPLEGLIGFLRSRLPNGGRPLRVQSVMDIRCPVCSEPWDLDELHALEGVAFDEAREKFYAEGCGLTFGSKECAPANDEASRRAEVSRVLADLLGDDIDGIAAMEEDYDLGF
jgi:hypothetical protein